MRPPAVPFRFRSPTDFAASVVMLLIAAATPALAATPGITFVPDVRDQFAKLAVRPEALGFHLGTSPDPEQCKHYQGMARFHVPGSPPYLFVSRSGNEPDGVAGAGCSDSDDPGNLLIVRMDSRDRYGERLRSNRLAYDSDIDHPEFPTPPDARDTTVAFLSFDGTGENRPAYGHPGGMQMVGDVLALGMEANYGADPANLVLFLDMSNPESPTKLSSFDPGGSAEFSAGLVGITPIQAPDGSCCRYLMVIAGKVNKELRIYRSLPTGASDGPSALKSSSLGWELVGVRTESQIEACLAGNDWHTGGGDAHQMLNFVRESDLNGDLYLIGGRNSFALPAGQDFVDLYRVHTDGFGIPDACFLTHVDTKQLTSKPIMGGGDSGNLAAAGGVYVSPTGELIVYSTEYENDGPFGSNPDGTTNHRTVRFSEWRHREIARPGSPTFRPSVDAVGGPHAVDEGSSITLEAVGRPPAARAYLQLFEDDGLGASLTSAGDSDDWLVVDYDDWAKDNFDDFGEIHFSDDAGSWRWFAPVGCTLRANDDDFSDDDFPGKYTRTLVGTGAVVEASDLDDVANDDGDFSMDDEVTSAEFFFDCDDYYAAPISVAWDLNGDNELDVDGNSALVSADGLDGPSVVSVTARGTHPTDPTELAIGAPVIIPVEVRNVPPVVQSFALVDAAGQEIGTGVPYALLHTDTIARVTFTDAGTPDTQAASIDWGDGSVDDSSTFDAFADATGGVVGSLAQTHVYEDPGLYTIRIVITDDDGGAVELSRQVEVVVPIEVRRARVRRSNRPGRPNGEILVTGDLVLGESIDLFTIAGGLGAAIRDGLNLSDEFTWSAAQCRPLTSGRITCKDGSVEFVQRSTPLSARPGRIRFRLRFRERDLTGPFAAPLSIDLRWGTLPIHAFGAIADCRTRSNAIQCH